MVSNFIHFFGPTNLCEPEVFRFSLVLLNYLFSTAEEAKLSISVQSGNLWNKFFFFLGGGVGWMKGLEVDTLFAMALFSGLCLADS